MKKLFPLISLAVALCAMLPFSCSSNLEMPKPPNELFPEYGYCVFDAEQGCMPGPASVCPSGGTLSNTCPYSGSSSSQGDGSSSGAKGYCVYPQNEQCLPGASHCLGGGIFNNTCPYGGSSSSSSSPALNLVLNCNLPAGPFYANEPITANAVCGTSGVASGLTWTNAPDWSNPVAGSYTNISVAGICGGSLKSASCGSITVLPVTLSCGNLPQTWGMEGVAIAPPEVTCSHGVQSNLNWASSPTTIDWSNPAAKTYTGIKAKATCGYTPNLEASCNGTLAVSEKPVLNKTIAFEFTNDGRSAHVYFIGETPTTNGPITITNSSNSHCNSPTVQIVGNTETDGIIKAYVLANCGNPPSPTKLDSAEARVVPNPSLSGPCTWNKNPIRNSETATPSGVTLSNSYGRCNVADGLVLAYSYNNANWTGTGLAAGMYSNVEPNVTCGSYTITKPTCPDLDVVVCDYEQAWCNGRTLDKVSTPSGASFTNNSSPFVNEWSTGSCFFINSGNIMGLATATFQINGKDFTSSGNSSVSIASHTTSVDGGYYIYRPAEAWFEIASATGGSLSEGCRKLLQ